MSPTAFPYHQTPLKELPFVVLDLETTGMTPPAAKITEIAMVPMGPCAPKPFHSLVDPGTPIPQKIIEITGITEEMVQGQPTDADIFPRIKKILAGGIFVAHNVPFDFSFFDYLFRQHTGAPLRMPTLDTLHLSRKYLKLPSHALGAVSRHLNIELINAHRAMADTLAVKGILEFFLNYLHDHGLTTGGALLNAGLIKMSGGR